MKLYTLRQGGAQDGDFRCWLFEHGDETKTPISPVFAGGLYDFFVWAKANGYVALGQLNHHYVEEFRP